MSLNSEAFRKELRARLAGAAGLTIISVGYELGSDDGAGLALGRELQRRFPSLHVHLTGSAPENFTGPVVRQRPSHIIFLDAAALGGEPGDAALIDAAQIKGITFSTHTLPLSTIMEYFRESIGATSFAIGIQPLNEGFGEGISPEVQQAVDQLAEIMESVLTELKLG